MGHRLATGGLARRGRTAEPLAIEDVWVRHTARAWVRMNDAAPNLLHLAARAWGGVAARAERVSIATLCGVTMAAILSAAGASTFLYWQASRALLTERELGRVADATAQVHAGTARLEAEWSSLNEPSRLQEEARGTTLRPIPPTQFTEAAKLPDTLARAVEMPPAIAPGSAAPVSDQEISQPQDDPAPVITNTAARPAISATPPALAPVAAHPHLVLAMARALPPPVGHAFVKPRMVQHMASATIDLPLWLTQPRRVRSRPLIMSEPPHSLALPAMAAVPPPSSHHADEPSLRVPWAEPQDGMQEPVRPRYRRRYAWRYGQDYQPAPFYAGPAYQ